MKLLLKSNGIIHSVFVNNNKDGTIESVEINFTPSQLYSDIEMWLDDNNGKLADYAKMNVGKRNKMIFYKR